MTTMEPSERSRVGVVGGDDAIRDAVERAGATALPDDGHVDGAAAALETGPDWVVAGDEAALANLVATGADVPVLPVDAGPGVPSVREHELEEVIRAVLSGDATTTTRRLYEVAVGRERAATMLRDAMLVTAEPARISEYGLHDPDGRVARFRADGVVLATPAGSRGYAGAAGGPVLAPGTGVLAAVPVAPFRTTSDSWVLGDPEVTLTVHRDEAVVLVVDGRETGRVSPAEPVAIRPDGALSLYAGGEDWKNSNGRRTE